MNHAITQEFVIAVHDEILRQTGIGRGGVHLERLEGVLGRIEQQIHYKQIDNIFEIRACFYRRKQAHGFGCDADFSGNTRCGHPIRQRLGRFNGRYSRKPLLT